jgi:hypothetical protein
MVWLEHDRTILLISYKAIPSHNTDIDIDLTVKHISVVSGILIGIKHLIFHQIWASWNLALKRQKV